MENVSIWDEFLKFIGNNWKALLGFVWTTLSLIRNVTQFFANKKQGIRIETLKSQLDVEKTKVLRNDETFRNSYQSFLNVLMDMLHKDKKLEEAEQWMIDFIKASILFASPETIKTLGEYRKIINEPQGDNSVLKYMDKLFLSMRKDLWVSNQSLKEFDILQRSHTNLKMVFVCDPQRFSSPKDSRSFIFCMLKKLIDHFFGMISIPTTSKF